MPDSGTLILIVSIAVLAPLLTYAVGRKGKALHGRGPVPACGGEVRGPA